jgi:hypothetical protein
LAQGDPRDCDRGHEGQEDGRNLHVQALGRNYVCVGDFLLCVCVCVCVVVEVRVIRFSGTIFRVFNLV